MLCILDKGAGPYRVQRTRNVGAGKKMPPSIIGGTCAFDSKIRVFLKVADFVSAYMERDKNFFRKIEIYQKLPSFSFEKTAAEGTDTLGTGSTPGRRARKQRPRVNSGLSISLVFLTSKPLKASFINLLVCVHSCNKMQLFRS
jgi:hypothetical protein